MKKLITLIFFVGFLTSSFAQSGRRAQYNDPNNNSRYQPSATYQRNDRGNENGYAYNNGRDNKRGDYRDRDNRVADRDYRYSDDMRRNQNYYPEHHFENRAENYHFNTQRRGHF